MIYNHFAYGEMLATKLKGIAHTPQKRTFFQATEQEEFGTLDQQVSQVSGTVLVAIDGANADFSWEPDNMTEKPQYFFVIVTPTQSDDANTIHQAQEQCRGIGKQIIAKMMNDCLNFDNGLATLDMSSFLIRGAGPIGDNFYGVLVGFNLLNPFEFTIDNTYWL